MGNSNTVSKAENDIHRIVLKNHKARRIHSCCTVNNQYNIPILITIAHFSDGGPAMMGGAGKSGEILIWYLSSKQEARQIHKISFQGERIKCSDIHSNGKYVAFSVGGSDFTVFSLPSDILTSNLEDLNQMEFIETKTPQSNRITVNGVHSIQKLKFFAQQQPNWILVNDKVIDFGSGQNLNSWSDDQFSSAFGFDTCITNKDWIFINNQNIIVLKKELNAIHQNGAISINATNYDESKEIVPFFTIPQNIVTHNSLQQCSDKENVVIRFNQNGNLFAICHLTKMYLFEILNDKEKGYKEQIELVHTHSIILDKIAKKQEITFLNWLDECTLIYTVRTVKNNKLNYNLFWLRSMKNDIIRQQLLNPYLMEILDLTKIILAMLGLEKSAPIQTVITQRVSNIAIIPLLSLKDDRKRMTTRKSNLMLISCCGNPIAKANQVLDCMVIHPITVKKT